ncbi:glycine-rich cell wall structural protein 1-like [Setaria italica]|uniref:glycine-rich cell wall structural protein 1-like n=1 Tax=Setaria italica TaxID=4555 RepID=UPI0003508A06|nr:glycine-rich cell wall structural protein 1-like [Setaria italica]
MGQGVVVAAMRMVQGALAVAVGMGLGMLASAMGMGTGGDEDGAEAVGDSDRDGSEGCGGEDGGFKGWQRSKARSTGNGDGSGSYGRGEGGGIAGSRDGAGGRTADGVGATTGGGDDLHEPAAVDASSRGVGMGLQVRARVRRSLLEPEMVQRMASAFKQDVKSMALK